MSPYAFALVCIGLGDRDGAFALPGSSGASPSRLPPPAAAIARPTGGRRGAVPPEREQEREPIYFNVKGVARPLWSPPRPRRGRQSDADPQAAVVGSRD